jgi:hypothetical protein
MKERNMENQLAETENGNAVITNSATEADNILSAVKEDAGFGKVLKFKKGEYLIGDDLISLGTEFLAHAAAWTKTWIKFVDGKVADRKLYRVAHGEKAPERENLDGLDLIGQKDADGLSVDPWVFQYLVPLENLSSGELVIFVTPSVGGKQAVRELCDAYAKRVKRGQHGQPIVQLAVTEMPSKKYGKVQRPNFEIVGWDDSGTSTHENLAAAIPAKDTGKVAANHDDMDGDIPF